MDKKEILIRADKLYLHVPQEKGALGFHLIDAETSSSFLVSMASMPAGEDIKKRHL